MIISHEHKFVFVAMPKTGSHAIRRALRPHMGPSDIEQVGLFVRHQFPFPELARIGHGHLSLGQVRPFIGEDVFCDYLKFAFVRNPFDRFVSYCAFMTRQQGHFDRDPRGTMRKILFEMRPMDHVHFQPQHTLIDDGSGHLLVDRTGRYEDMQGSFDEICGQIGIPTQALERVNSSRRGEYRQYYDQALIDGVTALYQRDLELFGYEF